MVVVVVEIEDGAEGAVGRDVTVTVDDDEEDVTGEGEELGVTLSF